MHMEGRYIPDTVSMETLIYRYFLKNFVRIEENRSEKAPRACDLREGNAFISVFLRKHW